MKNQTYGISGKPHQGMHPELGTYYFAKPPGEECRLHCGRCAAYGRARKIEALAAYKIARMNGSDNDSPQRAFPNDGSYSWYGEEYWGCAVIYNEGPGDRAWMQERDRNYIFRLEREGHLDKEEPNLQNEIPALHAEIIRQREQRAKEYQEAIEKERKLIEEARLKERQEIQLENDRFKQCLSIELGLCIAGISVLTIAPIIDLQSKKSTALGLGLIGTGVIATGYTAINHFFAKVDRVTERTLETTAVLKDTIRTISTGIRELSDTADKTIVILRDEIKDRLVEFKGSGKGIANAIRKGIDEGRFKPEAKIDIKIGPIASVASGTNCRLL